MMRHKHNLDGVMLQRQPFYVLLQELLNEKENGHREKEPTNHKEP